MELSQFLDKSVDRAIHVREQRAREEGYSELIQKQLKILYNEKDRREKARILARARSMVSDPR